MVFIFDIDGVVNKSDYFSVQFKKDFNVGEEVISEFFREEFHQCAKGKKDIKEMLLPYLDQWKWDKDVDALLAYWFKNDIRIDSELVAAIQPLRQHYRCLLASQQEVNRKQQLWEVKGLNKQFDRFYCTCDIGYLKKNPRFYEFMVDQLIEDKWIHKVEDIIYWDDSPRFLEAARSIGIHAIHFKENEDILKVIEEWI